MKLLDAARHYVAAGLSIVPIGERKQPNFKVLPRDNNGKAVWHPYQNRYPSDSELVEWFSSASTTGLAVVCGAISGGLRCNDFDDPAFARRWAERLGGKSTLTGLWVQRTSRGFQLFYRTPNPGKNEVLAYKLDESSETGFSHAIETRGEGGYALLPPSLHPSGKYYEWVRAGIGHEIPFIGTPQHIMWDLAARELNEGNPVEKKEPHEERYNGLPTLGQMIIQEFNASHSIEGFLDTYGYTPLGSGYVRPDGRKASVRLIYRGETQVTWHHNPSDKMSGAPRDAFDWLRIMEHDGDMEEALRHAAELVGIEWQDFKSKSSPEIPTFEGVQLMHNTGKSVILTDDSESAGILYNHGAAVALGPHKPWPREWIRQLGDYSRRFVVFGKPLDAAAEVTARELDAKMVHMPIPIPDFFRSGGTIVEFGHLLKTAKVPTYR